MMSRNKYKHIPLIRKEHILSGVRTWFLIYKKLPIWYKGCSFYDSDNLIPFRGIHSIFHLENMYEFYNSVNSDAGKWLSKIKRDYTSI